MLFRRSTLSCLFWFSIASFRTSFSLISCSKMSLFLSKYSKFDFWREGKRKYLLLYALFYINTPFYHNYSFPIIFLTYILVFSIQPTVSYILDFAIVLQSLSWQHLPNLGSDFLYLLGLDLWQLKGKKICIGKIEKLT